MSFSLSRYLQLLPKIFYIFAKLVKLIFRQILYSSHKGQSKSMELEKIRILAAKVEVATMNRTTMPFLTLILAIVIVAASVFGTFLLWPDMPVQKSVTTANLIAISE